MKRHIAFFSALTGLLVLASCAKPEGSEAPKPAAEAPAPTQAVGGPHVIVHLKDGSQVLGTIVASSQTDMVVAGEGGIEHKVPLSQIQSVSYGEGEAPAAQPPRKQASAEQRPKRQTTKPTGQPTQAAPAQPSAVPAQPPVAPPPPPEITTKTYELPAGSEISVRANETIDSETATEGQTFDVQVTRDANDAEGYVVIPRGSEGRIVIKSASKGGRFKGASDLVLDLQSVTIGGKQYTIDTADISEKGKSGVGANKRTAVYTGGGAALGAIIGAIAGGGRGAAIGAGAGAGAGVLTQVLTQGGAIKVPVESVLTFKLDKPLKVTVVQ